MPFVRNYEPLGAGELLEGDASCEL